LPDPLALETRDHRPYCGGALALEPERERIESGWWDGAEIARDYFIARNPQGRRFWVFRHLYTSQWFLHGVFG
jgi:protein ImuB